ncbi:uncharacterized protein FMAN_07315 [Fusarium mangiferae]|uniref:Uncharacterized protein n=1 Tax=Fusarium mangiferae TaxID=192010 RepID=A0A1L7T3D2_FUSMA|nr:uncharacterized protein FMAN_07315 [Fusarium mangiferae]CVK92419.1 uncharacterized protein FMAN_07315 [Fusarium mangiferae]
MHPQVPDAHHSSSQGSLRVVLQDPARPITRRERLPCSVPQTEEQWQSCRSAHGLDTLENILNKIARFEQLDRHELDPWEKLVIIAATIVDLSIGHDEDALELGRVYAYRLGYSTRRRDRAAVLGFIQLLDRLYAGLEHRAFELLVIWNVPPSSLRLWTSNSFEETFSEFSGTILEPKKEIQASVPFYIPFLVKLLRPQYTLNQIQKTLKTKALTSYDWDTFQRTCRDRQYVSCLLSTLGDFRTPHCQTETTTSQPSQELLAPNHKDESDSSSAVHLDKLYRGILYVSITGYTTFDISHELRRQASRAEKEQSVCNRIEKNGTRIKQYSWSDEYHLPVANQAIDDLVSVLVYMRRNMLSKKAQAGILCREDVFRQKVYVQHRGELKVKMSKLQVIIPTTSPKEPLFVSLSSSELSSSQFRHRIAWRVNRGLLLEQGTVLSTTESVFFISMATSLD